MTPEDRAGLQWLMREAATLTKQHVTERLAAAVAPLEQQIRALEQRVEELSQRGEYAGTWASDRRFKKGQICTYDGSAWVAKRDSLNVRPATDREHWQLMVRRGADGKDLRDHAAR